MLHVDMPTISHFVRLAVLVICGPFAYRLTCLEMPGPLQGAIDSVPLPVADRFPVLDPPLRPPSSPVRVVLDGVTVDDLGLLRACSHASTLGRERFREACVATRASYECPLGRDASPVIVGRLLHHVKAFEYHQ
jgi:hypothetical protein